MDQDVQSRVEELEQNVQAKDRELARKVLLHIVEQYCVCVCFDCRRNSCIPVRDNPSSRLG